MHQQEIGNETIAHLRRRSTDTTPRQPPRLTANKLHWSVHCVHAVHERPAEGVGQDPWTQA